MLGARWTEPGCGPSLTGQLFPGRPDPDPAGVGADVRHPDPEPVAAGAPGAEGVLLLHHGGHQQAQDQVAGLHGAWSRL